MTEVQLSGDLPEEVGMLTAQERVMQIPPQADGQQIDDPLQHCRGKYGDHIQGPILPQ